MPIASKLECVDGPRQQLTTRRRLRECLLQANPSILMAHANNSQQDGVQGLMKRLLHKFVFGDS